MLCGVLKDRTTESCFPKNAAELLEGWVIKAWYLCICSDSHERHTHTGRDTVTQSVQTALFPLGYPWLPYSAVSEDHVLSPLAPHPFIDFSFCSQHAYSLLPWVSTVFTEGSNWCKTFFFKSIIFKLICQFRHKFFTNPSYQKAELIQGRVHWVIFQIRTGRDFFLCLLLQIGFKTLNV